MTLQRNLMRSIIGGVAALAMLATGAGVASASAPTAGARAFAAQASAAGLTTVQASALQARVDGYLAKLGGTQVSANRIEFAGGAVLLALPGERQAAGVAAVAPIPCPLGYFCAYQWPNLGGDMIPYYYCNVDKLMPWPGIGSYNNNQTGGAQARFLNAAHQEIDRTRADRRIASSYDWTPVHYIDPC